MRQRNSFNYERWNATLRQYGAVKGTSGRLRQGNFFNYERRNATLRYTGLFVLLVIAKHIVATRTQTPAKKNFLLPDSSGL
ncbi:MAG: hypothetical protein WKF85_07215 [Chitinophagaceae bacterium]